MASVRDLLITLGVIEARQDPFPSPELLAGPMGRSIEKCLAMEAEIDDLRRQVAEKWAEVERLMARTEATETKGDG